MAAKAELKRKNVEKAQVNHFNACIDALSGDGDTHTYVYELRPLLSLFNSVSALFSSSSFHCTVSPCRVPVSCSHVSHASHPCKDTLTTLTTRPATQILPVHLAPSLTIEGAVELAMALSVRVDGTSPLHLFLRRSGRGPGAWHADEASLFKQAPYVCDPSIGSPEATLEYNAQLRIDLG